MNYKLILDENELNKFVNLLPDISEGERYQVFLFARRKYFPAIKSDRAQLQTKTCKKELIVKKIKQMETQVGSYDSDGLVLPNEALALYITPNARNFQKAKKLLLKKLIDGIDDPNLNPESVAKSCLQQSGGKNWCYDLDIDASVEVTEDLILEINSLFIQKLQTNCFEIVRTRGGCHILIKLDKMPKDWYQQINNIKDERFNIMMKGSDLTPIPGCTQGGFMPYLID